MKWLEKDSLAINYLLCTVVVFFAAWPAFQYPRLEADDYRYLHHIEQWSTGNMSAVDAMTVENRWDHLWFMQEQGKIRFFRPTVVLSYALDYKLWENGYPHGLIVTNILIHLGCSLLVASVLHRLLGTGLPAVLSSLLFAGLATHSECIWYIAGRTDSLAAFGFLAALALHMSGKRWWALPFFAFGFITKELVVVAPIIFIAHDFWINKRKFDWCLWVIYGAVAVGIWQAKQLALGGVGSDFVYPYLVSPLKLEFFEHLLLQLRSYAGNLFAAEVTVPFADAKIVEQLHQRVILIVGILFFVVGGWMIRRDRRLWFLLLLAALTWLPVSFVYLSERYLYLPSLAFVGFLGLFISDCTPKWREPLCLLLGVFTIFHTYKLYERTKAVVQQPGSVAEMLHQLESVQWRIEKEDRLLLVNLPGQFVRAQFAQEILRVALDDPDLKVDVLTMMPGQNGTEWKRGDPYPVMGASVQIRKITETKLVLEGKSLEIRQPPHPIQEPGIKAFNWARLDLGQYNTSTLETHVLLGSGSGATAIEVDLLQSLDQCKIIVWQADCTDLNEHPWVRRKNASVKLLQF